MPQLPNGTFAIPSHPESRLFSSGICSPPCQQSKVMQAALNRFQDTTLLYLQFCHEDDDAIAAGHVQKLHESATERTTYLTRHRPKTIDFNHRFTVPTDSKELVTSHRFSPFLGVALELSVMPESRRTVLNFQCQKMASFMPKVTLSDPSMLVRSDDAFNDSVKGGMSKIPKITV